MTHARSMQMAGGIVLPATLWVLAAMTALALSLALGARTQRNHAANLAAGLQADAAQQAALLYVLEALRDSDGRLPDASAMPACALPVGPAAFWLLAPDTGDNLQQRYGLADEGGKLDLNTAPAALLEKLPDMTPDVAAAIIDWRDSDDETTPGGAESDYYLRRPEPYNAKNGPFETVGELAMVAGVTDELLFGEDANRNGRLDDNENDGDARPPNDNRDGQLNAGLAGWTTAQLRWPPQQQGDGTIDPNAANRQELEDALAEHLEQARAADLAGAMVQARPFASLFHLHYACGLTLEEFAALEPVLVPQPAGGGQGPRFLLNLNAAPPAVLACLPELDETDAAALVEARAGAGADGSLAWALDVLDEEKLLAATAVGVTGRSYQYTADIVTLSANGRAFRRCRYLIDAAGNAPRVVHRQDLTHLGWPLESALRERLRAGEPFEDVLADFRHAAMP